MNNTPPPLPSKLVMGLQIFLSRIPGWVSRAFTALHLASIPPALAWTTVISLLLGPVFVVMASSAGARSFAGAMATPTFTLVPPTASFTLTPTSTATATSIFTATVTNTPTITLTSTVTFTPTLTFTPTVTLPAISPVSCIDPNAPRQVGKVTNITDGDTIHVVIDGVDYKIRYIGMDAPEQGAKGAAQATQFNSNLVLGKMVTLVKDVSETDRYDRLLRYVFVGDTFVNYELVANGLAHSGSWPPDTACDQVFAAAESRARLNQFGLWAPTFTPMPYVPPASTAVPFVPPLVEPTSPLGGGSSSCDPSYPDVCIAPPPPDLDCKDISYRNFRVLPPDPHNFDGNHDGYGCQS